MPESRLASVKQIGRAQSELQSHDNLVCRLLLEKKETQALRQDHQGRAGGARAAGTETARGTARGDTAGRATPRRGELARVHESLLVFLKEAGPPGAQPFAPDRAVMR